MPVINAALPEDLPAIRACAEAAYALYVPRIGRKPAPMTADFDGHFARGELYVSRDGSGACQGYVVFYPRGDHIHVENVAVDPASQGQGIGRALLHLAEATGRQQGLIAVELYTNAKMAENLALYPRLGYEEIERRTEDGFDRVFFRKVLAG